MVAIDYPLHIAYMSYFDPPPHVELQDAVEEVLPALREQGISVYILTDHVTNEGLESLTDKIAQASDEPIPADLRANITLSSPAVYIYTSGTTGKTGLIVLYFWLRMVLHQTEWTEASIKWRIYK